MNDILASIRPINPGAFGGIQKAPKQMPMEGGQEMTDYLMNKVEEIKRRLGQGDMGALSNVTELMRKS